MVYRGLPSFGGTILPAFLAGRLVLLRQEDVDRRPLAKARPDLYLPAMRLHNPRHDGQTQSGPLGFRRAQYGRKSPPALFFTHSLPGVLELHRNMRWFLPAAPQAHPAGLDSQIAALGHPLCSAEK